MSSARRHGPCVAVAVLPLLTAVLGGCTGDDPDLSPTSSPAVTVAPTASGPVSAVPQPASPSSVPSTAPPEDAAGLPFPADLTEDTREATGEPLVVTQVRVGEQDGFDRVVWELDGPGVGLPGWRVAYDADPRQQGSGEPFDVRGDAFLRVDITGVTFPAEGQEAVAQVTTALDGDAVTGVRDAGVFEGIHDAAVGVTGDLPFRVYVLDAPVRVVLEVVHPDRVD